jgi:ubiquinone/menaquinone biosynthesis C-methylase UbiE
MSHYIHGTSPEEQERLTLLNTVLLNDGCLKELALTGDEKILDVGSGLGQFSRAMAKAAKSVVLGVERSEEQIAEALNQAERDGEKNLVEYRIGDARQLPLRDDEWGTFDVAHTRFVLEHVPDPLNVVKNMVRAVKKGGRVVLADDDHDVARLCPEVPGLAQLWDAYMESYRAVGNDPIIGRKLTTLLVEAGASPVRNTWVFFGSCAGQKNFDAYAYNLISVISGAKDHMVQSRLFDESKFDRVVKSLEKWRQMPDAALWYAVSWAEGRK